MSDNAKRILIILVRILGFTKGQLQEWLKELDGKVQKT